LKQRLSSKGGKRLRQRRSSNRGVARHRRWTDQLERLLQPANMIVRGVARISGRYEPSSEVAEHNSPFGDAA
jgi:hypothetical protein